MHRITIGNITIDVIRKDIKNLHLGVYPPDGRVRIATPERINDEAVRLFAISKIAWIKKQKQKIKEQERQSRREYVSGESHYFLGRKYLLKVKHHNAPARVEITGKTHINMYIREGSSKEQREKVMFEWYRQELKTLLPGLVNKWEKIIGLSINEWKVKWMRTKWGTCNIKSRRIWLNLELAKRPERCLEYIIVHEMIHLFERKHNQVFIGNMDKYLPQWRSIRKELNQYIASYDNLGD